MSETSTHPQNANAVRVRDNVPLVALQYGEETAEPVPGRYYETADGRMVMCIKRAPFYFWFIDAENTPMTVVHEQQLQAQPLRAIDLVPAEEHV